MCVRAPMQRAELGKVEQGAGRVGRAGHHEPARARVPGGIDLRRRGLITAAGIDRQRARHALEGAHQVAVGGIAGVGQQPFVARLGGGGEREHQGARGPCGDDDALGRDVGAEAILIEACDRLAQRGQAEAGRVVHVAAADEGLGGLDDGAGVGKSGSPTSMWMMSRPVAPRARARGAAAP